MTFFSLPCLQPESTFGRALSAGSHQRGCQHFRGSGEEGRSAQATNHTKATIPTAPGSPIPPQLLPPKGPGESKGPLTLHIDAPWGNVGFAGVFVPVAHGKGTHPPLAPSSHPTSLPEEGGFAPQPPFGFEVQGLISPAHAQPRASPLGITSQGEFGEAYAHQPTPYQILPLTPNSIASFCPPQH